jgi:hypothetical protein
MFVGCVDEGWRFGDALLDGDEIKRVACLMEPVVAITICLLIINIVSWVRRRILRSLHGLTGE